MTTPEPVPNSEIVVNEDGSFPVASNPQHQEALQRLAMLQQALLAKDPSMPMHLKEIHRQLITYEELVHLLKPEDIGIIMAAQQQHTNTTLAAAGTTKSGKAAAVKASARLTISDL